MNYVEKENQILKEWSDAYQKDGGDYRFFSLDGIMFRGNLYKIDEGYWLHESDVNKTNQIWSDSKKRILFLTKDQNLGDGYAWDDRKLSLKKQNSEADDMEIRSEIFYRRILWTLYGLVMTTPQKMMKWDEFTNTEALKLSEEYPYARINCKKEGGGPVCPNDVLVAFMENYSTFLERQILNLDADIIVCCGSQNEHNVFIDFLNHHGYNFNGKEYPILYDETKKVIAIDAYHPQCRLSHSEYYKGIVENYYNFLQQYPQFAEKCR